MKTKLDIDAIVSNAVEEQFRKDRQKEYMRRPYMDLSEQRKKQKDHGGQYREVWKMLEKDINSKAPDVSGLAHLKLGAVCKEIAGRSLTETELKQVITYCVAGHRNKRWKINAFGQMYCTKEITSSDIETK